MGFEKVESNSVSGAEPKLSIRKNGSIGINNSALEEWFDEGDEYVELYYDEDNNKIGLEGVEEDSGDVFSLSRGESGGSITPMAFLRSRDLIGDNTKQYLAEEEDGMVVIDLDDVYNVYDSGD